MTLRRRSTLHAAVLVAALHATGGSKAEELCFSGTFSALTDAGALARAQDLCARAQTTTGGGICAESPARSKADQLGLAATCLRLGREAQEVVRIGYACGTSRMSSRMKFVAIRNNCERPVALYTRSGESAYRLGAVQPNHEVFLVLSDTVQGLTAPKRVAPMVLLGCDGDTPLGKESNCLKAAETVTNQKSTPTRARTEAEDLFADALTQSPEKLIQDAEAFRSALARSAEVTNQRALDAERIGQSPGGGNDGLAFVLGFAGGALAGKVLKDDAIGQAVMQEVWRNSDDPTTRSLGETYAVVDNAQRAARGVGQAQDPSLGQQPGQIAAELAQWALQESAKQSGDDPVMHALANTYSSMLNAERTARARAPDVATPFDVASQRGGQASPIPGAPRMSGDCEQDSRRIKQWLEGLGKRPPSPSMADNCQLMADINRAIIPFYQACRMADIRGDNLRHARENLSKAEECVRMIRAESAALPASPQATHRPSPNVGPPPSPPPRRPRMRCEDPMSPGPGQC